MSEGTGSGASSLSWQGVTEGRQFPKDDSSPAAALALSVALSSSGPGAHACLMVPVSGQRCQPGTHFRSLTSGAASHSPRSPTVSCCGTTVSLTTNWSQSRPVSHQAVSECASVHTYTQVDTAREEGRPWASLSAKSSSVATVITTNHIPAFAFLEEERH